MSLRFLIIFLLIALRSSILPAQLETKLVFDLVEREGIAIEIPIGQAMSLESRLHYHRKRRTSFFVDQEIERKRHFFSSLLMVKRYFKAEKERAGFYWGIYAFYDQELFRLPEIDDYTPAQVQSIRNNDIDKRVLHTRLGIGPFIGYKYLFANGISLESSLGIATSARTWIKTRRISFSNQTSTAIYDPNVYLFGELNYYWPNLQIAVGYRFK
ncbi:MAG: hypothetical protein AAF927_30795 [Bacteroidota bacterium]